MGISIQENLKKRLSNVEFAKEYGASIAKAEIAVSVAQARRNRNITQEELANELGVTQAYVAKLESGDANPTIGKIGQTLACMGLRMAIDYKPLDSKIEEKTLSFESIGSTAMTLLWNSFINEGIDIHNERFGDNPICVFYRATGVAQENKIKGVISTGVVESENSSGFIWNYDSQDEGKGIVVSGGKK